ncbi:MAG: PilN domain-containing protein [Ahniella sp.]|nr:PilN domain-containing protein [Ahniella sp.]
MSDSIITKRFAKLRSAYRSSTLYRFLDWWGRELLALVPARLLGFLSEQRDEMRLFQRDGMWRIERLHRGEIRDALDVPADADQQSTLDLLRGFVARAEGKADLVLGLPERQLLSRRVTLPLAAEENLDQVLGFELDRQTPFKADQVWLDHRTIKRDTAAKQLLVEVLMAPKAICEQLIAPFSAADLRFAAADGVRGDSSRLGFNLLPPDRRARRSRTEQWINALLALVCLGMLWAVMQASLSNRQAALDDLQAKVDAVRLEAQATDKLRDELEDAVDGANFLDTRKRAMPVTVDILRDVTIRLPDDTSLSRFQVTRGEVQLQGQSDNAAGLVPVLQKSSLIEAPAIQGAITPGSQNKKEMFLIQARAKLDPEAVAKDTRERNKKREKGKKGGGNGRDA